MNPSQIDRFLKVCLVAVCAGALATGVVEARDRSGKAAAKDAPAAPARTETATGAVATIGETQVTSQELTDSLTAESKTALEDLKKAVRDLERQAVTEIFARRYVQEQLRKEKLTEDALYERETGASRASFPKATAVRLDQIRMQEFQIRNEALQRLIDRKLVEQAASAAGMTPEALLKTEVDDKIPPVTPEDVDAFYSQNRGQMGGQAKEVIAPRIEQYLKSMRSTQRLAEYHASLRSAERVTRLLEVPPVPDLSDDDPVRGPKAAPVQIVLFSDYQCPFCSRVEDSLDKVRARYGDKVAVTFRDFPLSFHANAQKAAEAANCAGKQGKYWEYHDATFAHQGELTVPDLKKRAETIGLDVAAFNGCLDSGETAGEIQKDIEEGTAWGVSGTPASFINGQFYSGAQPYESFTRIIDEELRLRGLTPPPPPAIAAEQAQPAPAGQAQPTQAEKPQTP